MEFGIGLMGEHPAQRMRALCQLIESLGFDQIWVSDERFYRDVFVNMTLAVCLTRKVKVGSMVTDPFVRHPAVTAAAAASVDELSGGRCILGMGAGISGFEELGIQRVRPARAITEAVQLIHRITGGERDIIFEGESIRFRRGHLNFPPLRPVRVYVAGRGPRVLEVAGEVADGVVIGSYASERGIAWGLDCAAKGARHAGRRLEDIAKVSWLYTSISSDGRRARDAVRTGVAVAMWGSHGILPQIGVRLPPDVLHIESGGVAWTNSAEQRRLRLHVGELHSRSRVRSRYWRPHPPSQRGPCHDNLDGDGQRPSGARCPPGSSRHTISRRHQPTAYGVPRHERLFRRE